MGSLEGRVAIVTGAGRGLGRSHALLLAAEGASVVVNDLGGALDGTGCDPSAAEAVAAEIRAAGGNAVASDDDCADWEGAGRIVALALESFGDLHVLVNNAGILRDRALVNMQEADWDEVIRVDLKGHFAPTRHAAAHWRAKFHASGDVQASVINTTSTSGLAGNPGQSHYGTAKAGVAAFTVIVAQELRRYGVRVNAITPAARTRMTETAPGLAQLVQPPDDPEIFDDWDPANASPLVAYLAAADCPVSGRVFSIQGGTVQLFEPWHLGGSLEKRGRWTIGELCESMPMLLR
ncbi:MAG TPA: SDR family oxidoreductase [Acidimicrobiales bacterium]|nr:SDR family oxidoreductase [Acidimicrobiales bacterium]